MKKKSRFTTHKMTCPEKRGETSLLLEWQSEKGKELLNSIRCANPELKDLSGRDCQWSCWEKITKGAGVAEPSRPLKGKKSSKGG
jgi:hypothetical protein